MIDGYDTLVLSFIAPLIAKDWSLLPSTVGALLAASYAGAGHRRDGDRGSRTASGAS